MLHGTEASRVLRHKVVQDSASRPTSFACRTELCPAAVFASWRSGATYQQIGILLYKFLSTRGQCFPSYSALATVTGLCRESIARAVSRLEQCGILKIIRRIVRKEVWDAERDRWFIGVVQTSNC